MHVGIPDHAELPQVVTSRTPMFMPPLDICSHDGDGRRRTCDFFINKRYAECFGIGTMSNGSMSPDLGEMWRHGHIVSPQWEGKLELDSVSDCDNEYEEDRRLVARNLATEIG